MSEPRETFRNLGEVAGLRDRIADMEARSAVGVLRHEAEVERLRGALERSIALTKATREEVERLKPATHALEVIEREMLDVVRYAKHIKVYRWANRYGPDEGVTGAGPTIIEAVKVYEESKEGR
jgi:hypothetical protein